MEEKLYFAHVVDDMVVEVKETTQEWVNEQEDSEAWIQTYPNVIGGVHYIETKIDGVICLVQDEEQNDVTIKRKNFAGIGNYYDKEKDSFYGNQPYSSWTLNEETYIWEAPLKEPISFEQGYRWYWNEKHKKWAKIKIKEEQYGWK